jgi:hypothetical protein
MTISHRIQMPQRGLAPALTGATGWLNSSPLTPEKLRGHVVLYVFCTYTCINWVRTLPYVRAWDAKYGGHSLMIVGVHTPEFAFEQDIGNVGHAVRRQGIDFPVALDSGYEIWRSFDNHYWPALYLADHRGVIRYVQFGEGRYKSTEHAIQQLLSEAGVQVNGDLVEVNGTGHEAPADWDDLESAEAYLGYRRPEGFTSDDGLRRDIPHDYRVPSSLPPNSWALSGEWTIRPDRITAHRPGTRIATRFRARDLHLVMRRAERPLPLHFRVSLDGRAPGQAHGLDVDAAGAGVVVDPRRYQLLRQPHPIADHTAEITFLDGGAEAFVITFG